MADIVRVARSIGFEVCATSNGENGSRMLPLCAVAGLDRVNFSVFGTTGQELAQVQHVKFADSRRGDRKIRALHQSIQTALDHGIKVSANIVVPNADHAPRVHRLLSEFSSEASVRLLNSLDDGQPSIDAIVGILSDLDAVPVARYVTAGVSGCRTAYRLPGGRVIHFKQIRHVRLPQTCAGCRYNNDTDCQEGYYGVRLYRDRAGGYQVGVCIQRMDLCMPVEDFIGSDLQKEIVTLRDIQYAELTAMYRQSANDTTGAISANRV